MVLSRNDKELIRERIKKQIEALKTKTRPITPPKEETFPEGEEA
jgi:hypothetical protein